MGKASRWFRSFLGLKKHDQPPPAPSEPKEKRRWSLVKPSHKDKTTLHPPAVGSGSYADDPNKHAIAVAAATAAVAEAAVAAAQAAAAVVRLTSSGRCNSTAAYASAGSSPPDELAAVKIQSAFRAYLARRALRALKGLVKLQALVRGHIVRRQTADTLRRMHALLRAQARVRAVRAVVSEAPSYLRSKSSQHYHPPGPPTPEKLEHSVRTRSTGHDPPFMLKRSGSRSSGSKPILNQDRAPPYGYTSFDPRNIGSGGSSHRRSLYPKNFNFDDDKSDKILEVDTGKPYLPLKTRNAFCSSSRRAAGAAPSDLQSNSFSTSNQTVQSPSSFEAQSPSPLKIRDEYSIEDGDASFCTADNSPQFYSASSRGGSSRRSGGPFTPAKSDSGGGSRTSYLDGYPDHPNYMAYTESSRAKARSVSAPKQRPRYERLGSTKRYSRHGFAESKAYPGSGLLDRLGMPVQNVAVPSAGGFSY